MAVCFKRRMLEDQFVDRALCAVLQPGLERELPAEDKAAETADAAEAKRPRLDPELAGEPAQEERRALAQAAAAAQEQAEREEWEASAREQHRGESGPHLSDTFRAKGSAKPQKFRRYWRSLHLRTLSGRGNCRKRSIGAWQAAAGLSDT